MWQRPSCAAVVGALATHLFACSAEPLADDGNEGAGVAMPTPVEDEGVEVAAPGSEAQDTEGSVYWCVKDEAALRDAPRSDTAAVMHLPRGARVVVLEGPANDAEPWYEVSFGGQHGWAVGADLEACDSLHRLLLPWQAGERYRVSQGHHSGSHLGNGAWAWDLALPAGTPVLAAHAGVVRLARFDSRRGACDSSAAGDANYVVLDRGDGVESLYLHLGYMAADDRTVQPGQRVERGEVLGYSGQTGWACGPHLHFQLQKSPAAGGTSSWYNRSLEGQFWDTGAPVDPQAGEQPLSANGKPGNASPESLDAYAERDFHGNAGIAWDRAMTAAASQE